MSPCLYAGGDGTLGVLLVHRLARDAESLGDLAPTPAGAQSAVDLGSLEQIGEAAQGDHGREAIGWVVRV